MTIFCRYLMTACIFLFSSSYVQAHDFWIEPDDFSPVVDAPVAVSLRYGVDFKGESLPFIDALFTDFSMTDMTGRTDIKSRLGNDPAAVIDAMPGAQLLGYQSVPQFVELNAEKFSKYVEDEGIEYIRAERERRGESNLPAPENFIRCAKALIQTGSDNHEVYQQNLGYTLELIPQSDPYQLEKGDTLEFELLYKGKPIDGLQLQAKSKIEPENVQKIRTDKNGKASITIDRSGIWLVKAVLILPVERRQQINKDTKTAFWQSYWASYVFELADES